MAGTERCPYGEFGPPTFAAHQAEDDDVGTRNRQDEADGREEHAERGGDVSDDLAAARGSEGVVGTLGPVCT